MSENIQETEKIPQQIVVNAGQKHSKKIRNMERERTPSSSDSISSCENFSVFYSLDEIQKDEKSSVLVTFGISLFLSMTSTIVAKHLFICDGFSLLFLNYKNLPDVLIIKLK